MDKFWIVEFREGPVGSKWAPVEEVAGQVIGYLVRAAAVAAMRDHQDETPGARFRVTKFVAA